MCWFQIVFSTYFGLNVIVVNKEKLPNRLLILYWNISLWSICGMRCYQTTHGHGHILNHYVYEWSIKIRTICNIWVLLLKGLVYFPFRSKTCFTYIGFWWVESSLNTDRCLCTLFLDAPAAHSVWFIQILQISTTPACFALGFQHGQFLECTVTFLNALELIHEKLCTKL